MTDPVSGVDFLVQYGIVGIMFVGAIAFAAAALIISRIFAPHRPYDRKRITYECGMLTEGTTWVRYKTSYFLYALIFLIFDVETVFLYPWAVAFHALGLFGLIEMLIFIAILVAGLWYAWKEGVLKWQ